MSRDFFNKRAPIWDEAVAEKDHSKLKALAEKMDIERGSTVLDIGTGTGVFVPFLLEKIDENGKLVCLDFAEEMLKLARSKNFRGNIDYLCADIADSGLETGQFDYIVCYSSFPHFYRNPHALEEIRRILRPGGKLFICHSSSREKINHIHSQTPSVCDHLLSGDEEITGLLAPLDFIDINIESTELMYFISAKRSSVTV